MRILFTRQQPLTAPGGESSHLFAIANAMRGTGVDVYLMPVTDTPAPASLWPSAFVRNVPPFGLHPLFDSFSLSRAVSAFTKATPVDAVISWQYETAYLSTFTHSRDFVHAVIAAAPFGALKKKAGASFSRRIAYHFFHFRQLHQADVIYVASTFAKNELTHSLGISPEKIVIIPIGVDDIFQPPSISNTGPIHNFIFTGSLEPIKGIFDALAALAILRQRGYKDWSLKICGWGDEAAVRQVAVRYGFEHQIEFAGSLDRSALAVELAQADLAILPSHTETFGLSIAEAQACGLPVVSYRTGAIPEVVADRETALLADPFDQPQLAGCIIQCIEKPALAREMGRRGAQRMREKFSWEKTAQAMLTDIANRKNAIR